MVCYSYLGYYFIIFGFHFVYFIYKRHKKLFKQKIKEKNKAKKIVIILNFSP
jgi:hypothetical protein